MIDAPCPELGHLREKGKPLLMNVADAQFRCRLDLYNDICMVLLHYAATLASISETNNTKPYNPKTPSFGLQLVSTILTPNYPLSTRA